VKYSDGLLAVIVLAAGFSIRLGQPKPLARVQGMTLLARLIATLEPLNLAPTITVIIPPRAARYTRVCTSQRVHFIANPARAAGLSSSVRLAVRKARYCAGVLLIPVDLVDLSGRDIARLVRRWRGSRRRVVASTVDGAAATPLILPHWLFGHVRRLDGDQGLRSIVRRLDESAITRLAMASAATDVDTPWDLQRARRRTRRKY
jgi:CTP:molybdopterin cytidylyltransferase MocA